MKNNRGQMAAYEAVIIMVLIIALGFCVYLLLSKQTLSNVFQNGSNPKVDNIQRKDYPFSIHIGEGGCSHRIPSINPNSSIIHNEEEFQ